MTTKAQDFRYLQERSGPKKAPQPPKPRRDVPVDTSKPGVSATDRKAGGGRTASRNFSKHGEKRAVYALEDSATGKPSRKSTRKAANRMKFAHPVTVAKRFSIRRESRHGPN